MRLPAKLCAGALALTGLLAAGTSGASVSASSTVSPNDNTNKSANPIHVFPTPAEARRRTQSSPASDNLTYHGGPVLTPGFKTYLVFWGSQWGTGSAQTTLTGDYAHAAHVLVGQFTGLGQVVPNAPNPDYAEQFSNTTHWYCQGIGFGDNGLDPDTGCAKQSAANHVGYPTGGGLTGIYNDIGTAEPATATGDQLASEADRAARHFSQTSNSNAQYIIVSGPGTHPDGFGDFVNHPWCAWHSYASATGTAHPYTNLPYLPDVGAGCGGNFVNSGSAGTNDGTTIVAGHEYSETVTDPQISAWWDPTTGNENSDKCVWRQGYADQQVNLQNVKLKTGSFAFQSNWLNSRDFNGTVGNCAISSK